MKDIKEEKTIGEKTENTAPEKAPAVTSRTPFWSRKMTNVIKTVGIFLMLIHHFFTIPDYHPENVNYPWASIVSDIFSGPTKICVGLFAFVTGYMYYFNKKKDLCYSLKSIWNLLAKYWIVAVPLTVIAIATGLSRLNIISIVKTLTGYSSEIMRFGWYVYFFIFMMLYLFLIVRICKDNPIALTFVSFILLNALASLVYSQLDRNDERLLLAFSNCWRTICPAMAGYLIARTGLFETMKKFLDRIPAWIRYPVLLFAAYLAMMFPKNWYHATVLPLKLGSLHLGLLVNKEIIHVPVFVFCLVELFSFIERAPFDDETKKHPLVRFFEIFGKYSTFMWFWHSMFFGVLGKYTKGCLYAPRVPVLVFIWGVLICLALSFVSDKVLTLLTPKKRLSSKV